MINKVLKLFPILIISVLISMNLSNSVYAVDESIACRVDFGKTYPITPSNPLPGQEITIQPVIKDITYPIAMVSFVIEYDSTKIEYVSKEGTDDWDLDLDGTTFIATTKTKEPTAKTGKLGTIKLKVKDDATKSDTALKFTKVSVVGDDYNPITIEDISIIINISSKDDQYVNPPADTNNEEQVNNNNNNENTNNENNNNENNNNINNNNENNNNNANSNNNNKEQQTQKPSTSTDVDNSKIVVINGNINSGSSTKAESSSKDSSTTNKSLPKTGITTICTGAIVIALIGMVASFMAYRKYKNI